MEHVKMSALLAVAAVALASFVGTASATVTSPAGTKYSGVLKATSTNFSLDGSVQIGCGGSTYEGTVTNDSTSFPIDSWTFSLCGNDTFTVLNGGSLSMGSSGALTSTGLRLTVQLHRVIFFPITTHCIYETNNTQVGTLTEGVVPAEHHVGSSPIPDMGTDSLCGNDAVWTGTYTVEAPNTAITVD